ncbi:MAG: signal peptide peptidase SppA [Victivallales bacterium]|nr:signal peptide peptidase SppA [Victivallales bacterium]
MSDDFNSIPEATPVPPLSKPASWSSPPRSGNTFKGFAAGCLVSCGIVLLVVMLCIGSCAYLGGLALRPANVAGDLMEEKPAMSLLRAGTGKGRIAVIAIHGTIAFTSESPSLLGDNSGAAAQRICRELRAANSDPEVVAVILDMNTPGGEVVASDEIRHEVDLLRKAGKPVVTCMHTLGASGGYYIASGSDWIVANRLTLTGSVGVIMQSVEASELLDKVGLEPVTYRSGNFKDMLSPMRKTTPEEDAYITAMVQADFREFCQVIANGRPRHFATVDDVLNAPFADGRVVSGADAYEMRLIDALGDFDDAVQKARALANAPDAPVYVYSLQRDWLSRLMLMADSRVPVEIKGLDRVLPGAELQPGMRYYLLPQAAR